MNMKLSAAEYAQNDSKYLFYTNYTQNYLKVQKKANFWQAEYILHLYLVTLVSHYGVLCLSLVLCRYVRVLCLSLLPVMKFHNYE